MIRAVPPKVLLISACLFLLLTVCFLGSLGYSSTSQADINTYFRRLERADLFIVNDVLKTRFQLLQHYDTITQNTLRFEQDLSHLQRVIAPRGDAATSTALSKLQQAQTERNDQVEDFKTDFSVLSNSLNYLPSISQLALQASLTVGNSALSEAIRQLQVNLLVDTLGSDTIEQNSVIRDLNTVSQASLTADGEFKSLLQNLAQHVQLILRVRDDTQTLLEGISQNSVQNQIEQLASAYNAHQEAMRQQAHRYRLGLYIISLTLILYFIYLYRYQQKNRFLQAINQSLESQVVERTQALRATMDQLQTSQIQLVQQEKMSALGNLVAGVAHEINNPIGFVRGNVKELRRNLTDVFEYLELYQQQAPQEAIEAHADAVDMDFLLEDMPKMLVSMETGCDRIHSISTSLRIFSRVDKETKSAFNLHEGLDSTLLILKYRLKAKSFRPAIQIVRNYGDIPEIDCFPGQINQVFMNILANAIDMFDEVAEEQSYDTLRVNPQQITIHTCVIEQADTRAIKISIADNGKGMSRDTCSKIFERQFTTKTAGKGTGLGLAIAQQIVVENHAGNLNVRSEIDQGTEFSIFLPFVFNTYHQPKTLEPVKITF